MHIHVGNNMPGYLPDETPYCVNTLPSAVEFLRSELRSLQDDYYTNCAMDSGYVYDHENPVQCECRWCDVAGDIEDHLSHISDGDVNNLVWRFGEALYYAYPPEGPDLVFWLRVMSEVEGSQDDCKMSEDW